MPNDTNCIEANKDMVRRRFVDLDKGNFGIKRGGQVVTHWTARGTLRAPILSRDQRERLPVNFQQALS